MISISNNAEVNTQNQYKKIIWTNRKQVKNNIIILY